MKNYNLIWAVAILRDDYGLTWRAIGERLNIEKKRASYIYAKRKKHYNLTLGAAASRREKKTEAVVNID